MRRIISFVICLLAVTGVFLPAAAFAEKPDQKVVRVGWYESPFEMTDGNGRRSGYAYEYQQRIANYTGWTYEYVEGSWPELMEMLVNGQIDLLNDVSYTDERAELMLYSSLPMGAEEYYLYAAPENEAYSKDDLSTFNGARVGVNKGSVQAGYLRNWAENNHIELEVVELTCSEYDSLAMLDRGEIDLYLTLDYYSGDVRHHMPLCKVGSSDIFFAVSKSRPELLTDLNMAMNRIHDVNRFYNEELYFKYYSASGIILYLNNQERDWLSEHGAIRVGYQDNYLAFCARDPKTGELTGALKDYLAFASECLENAQLVFEPVAYPTAEAAMEALRNGEVDCMFPANLTDYDGERSGISMLQPLIRTDMSAIVRSADQQSFAQKEQIVVAVNEGNPNYDGFLLDHFPNWQIQYFADTQEGLKAVADGRADCLLISNYRYNNIARLCEKYRLISLSTGVEIDYSFAVRHDNRVLYSILAKITSVVPASAVNASMSYYFTEDAKTTVVDFLKENLGFFITALAAIALVYAYLLIRNARSEKKAHEGEELITATERDPLTGLYNRSYFYEFAHRMYLEHPEKPMDAVVLNIERFHSVNAMNGQTYGDELLRTIGRGILAFADENEGIGGRSIGDHFAVYCRHMDDPSVLFTRIQARLDAFSSNAGILIRMGVMPWQEGTEPAQLFEHAQIACNMARGHYKEHLIVFDKKAQEREAYEERLLNDLHRAIENREFEVYYQPKYDIQAEPHALKSAEALVRWRHPELGMIPPGDFVPLFEHNGQISILDKYVWAETVRQIAHWREKYGVVIPVSVNLSRVDVFDPALEHTLDSLLEANGLDCGAIKLEVTESAYTENADQVIGVIAGLRNKGYEIEMDDFGSGYSSLNMLSSMPVDVLKMDRAFIMNIEHDEKEIQLVELILGIARGLKVPVIAEGVETEAQLQLLKKLGCELVQGYYFSRPLPADAFEEKYLK